MPRAWNVANMRVAARHGAARGRGKRCRDPASLTMTACRGSLMFVCIVEFVVLAARLISYLAPPAAALKPTAVQDDASAVSATCCCAHAHRSPVLAPHARGHAALVRQRGPQARPGLVDAGPLQLHAQQLHAWVDEHGDEPVYVAEILFRMEDRTQAQLAVEAAEHALQVGEHHTGPPALLLVPADLVATQAVHPGGRGHGARNGQLEPRDGRNRLALLGGGRRDFAMLTGAATPAQCGGSRRQAAPSG